MLLTASVAVGAGLFGSWLDQRSNAPFVPATVKVNVGSGHGSGVHIGNGFVVTAAHVVEDSKTADVIAGGDTLVNADVLWASKDYDVAMLKLSVGVMGMNIVKMDCRTTDVGETVFARGYPLDFGDIITKGQVAGKAQPYGTWKSAVFVDITGGPGMSGGPVISAVSGKLRGITVGGLHPMSPIMLMVPTTAICGLLANGGA